MDSSHSTCLTQTLAHRVILGTVSTGQGCSKADASSALGQGGDKLLALIF